jgi:hypothetical protein
MVQGCTRTKQTFWTEDQFTVTASSGIRDRNVRVVEIVVRELEKDKPDKLGCVQTRDLWSPEEERQVCPGHFWLLKFGKVPGTNSCVEKKFKLVTRKSLVVDVWIHRVDEDASGLTFEEWDPSADTDPSEAPVTVIVNSSELYAAGFDLREVIPLQLETATRSSTGSSMISSMSHGNR